MPAYAIGLYDVSDWSWHKQYKDSVTKLIKKHGGRYLARSSICPWEMLEGKPPQDATSFTLIEFPSMDHARAWYQDVEYQPYIALRQKGSTLKLILVDGCEG
jgi:uncharacterized protein (DUF1330 family)